MSPVPTLSTNWTIRFVPAEVWRRIFQFIASTSQPFDPAGIVDIIRVSHVCSTWRDIANNSPELWTNVALSFDQEGGEHCFPNEKLLALILRRSRTLPLTMGLVARNEGTRILLADDTPCQIAQVGLQSLGHDLGRH